MSIAEKLVALSENVKKVYEAGKRSEYDRFWDAFQSNGNRARYDQAFGGTGWTNETFKPKYDIKFSTTWGSAYGAYMIFRYAQIEGSLPDILEELGIALSWENNSNLNYAFQGSLFTRIGEVISNSTAYDSAFHSATKLEMIDGITSSSGNITKLSSTFNQCTALKEIRFNSVIGCNLDIHWSTLLSAGSLESIVTHLSDTVTGYTLTLPTTAEANYNTVHGDGAWSALVATKTNWTIAYA